MSVELVCAYYCVYVHMHVRMHACVHVYICVEQHDAVVKILGSQSQVWEFNSHLGTLAVVTLSKSHFIPTAPAYLTVE